MVVYDFGGNGYRDIILPLACQDETVAQAVCAVAAFHLGSNGLANNILETAEATQHAVLTRLSRDSRELTPNQVFTMTTWAAVMVLLVGETITAHSNFIQLLGMLRPLAKSAHLYHVIPQEARSFLQQQTRMSVHDPPLDGNQLSSKVLFPGFNFSARPSIATTTASSFYLAPLNHTSTGQRFQTLTPTTVALPTCSSSALPCSPALSCAPSACRTLHLISVPDSSSTHSCRPS